jgi:hypothetical protein
MYVPTCAFTKAVYLPLAWCLGFEVVKWSDWTTYAGPPHTYLNIFFIKDYFFVLPMKKKKKHLFSLA